MFERLARFFVSRWGIIRARVVIGLLAPLLQNAGNPPNMGVSWFCRARTGPALVVRFVLRVFAMIGALAFLGRPWRALLRLADGNSE
jgi:hypothetical protein